MKKLLKYIFPNKIRSIIREYYLAKKIIHISGPKALKISAHEAIVTCVVKNGEFYIESFIEYYLAKGFTHLFFLDNGSSDQTISLAQKFKNVSVFRCELPIESYQTLFKKYLAKKSIVGGWCLDTDIDEFFDYAYSDIINLHQFLNYLNREKYSAVITQLLDMFSVKPFVELEKKKRERNLSSIYQYYDISNIRRENYSTSQIVFRYGNKNRMANDGIQLLYGGIRRSLYGNDCLLTKHSLFLPDKNIQLFPHVHFVNNASVADISCIMRHYKLTSNAIETAIQNKNNFLSNSAGYNAFIDFIIKDNKRPISGDFSYKFDKVETLLKFNFVNVSDNYVKYIKEVSSK